MVESSRKFLKVLESFWKFLKVHDIDNSVNILNKNLLKQGVFPMVLLMAQIYK